MSDLGEWDNDPAVDDPAADSVEEAPPRLYFGSVDDFVREMIVPVFRREVNPRADLRWSARWWESAEAVITLEALWRAWEHLRLDPALGMSVWLRDHLHPHLAVLMSPTGPFGTTSGAAGAASPLPYEPPPEGLFPDVRQPASGVALDELDAEGGP